jgi:prepilin-type N-terminal cleavage/methylation domain-containing protein
MIKYKEKGFTLIEIIFSLVLMAIIAAVVSMGFLEVVKGYFVARINAETVEKGQMTITKMIKELSNCTITSGTATSVSFTRRSDGTAHTITYNGTTVLLFDGDTLTDQLNGIVLAYYDNTGAVVAATAAKQVQITLQLTVTQLKPAGSTIIETFTNRVYVSSWQ